VYVADIARAEFEAMRAEGINLTLDEAVQLNAYGCAVECPEGESNPALSGGAVRCGNVTLRPLTGGAEDWWAHCACRWFQTDRGLSLATAFACVVGRTAGSFDGLDNERAARRAVMRWAWRCTATSAELKAAVLRVVPALAEPHTIPAPPGAKTKRREYVEVLAEIAALSGLPAEYWMVRTNAELYAGLRAIYQQSAVMGGGGTGDTDTAEYQRASWEFMKCADLIRKAHAANNEAVNGA